MQKIMLLIFLVIIAKSAYGFGNDQEFKPKNNLILNPGLQVDSQADLDMNSNSIFNAFFDADLNSLSNVDDADIKAGANIQRNKLASGTANYVLINDGSGVFSEEQFLDKSRGGAGADMSAVTFPSTGTIPTNGSVSTFTNKTYDGGVAAGANNNYLIFPQNDIGTLTGLTRDEGTVYYANDLDLIVWDDGTSLLRGVCEDCTQDLSNKTFTDEITLTELGASPGTPAAGDKLLYCKTDDSCYFKNDAGTEVEIATGAAAADPVVFRSWVQYAALSTPAPGVNIDFDAGSIDVDTDSGWDSVNNYYVIPEDGYYIVTAGATFVNMAYTFIYYVSLYDTGVEVSNYWDVANRFEPAAAQGVQDFGGSAYPTGPAFFSAGDQISVRTSTRTINASESGSIRHILSIIKF